MPTYTVKRGDYPSSIAKKFTGSEGRHAELLDANPDFRKGNGRWKTLKTGDVLQLPAGWADGADRETQPALPEPEPESAPAYCAVCEHDLCMCAKTPEPPPGSRFPATKTKETPTAVYAALQRAWLKLFNDVPSPESLSVLVAHWALETGWGDSCWNWNLGNVKSRPGDGLDHTYYPCWEVLPKAAAFALAKNAGVRADGKPGPDVVVATEQDDGTAVVWFYPDHNMCRFRAFRSLDAGAEEYLKVLFHRFKRAWASVTTGDPSGFAAALKGMDYFTAPLDGPKGYRTALVSVFNRVAAQVKRAA